MKIDLVRLKDRRTSNVLDFPLVENIGLGYLCSTLRERNYETEIIDEEIQNISREKTLDKLTKSDLIGFTATAKPQIYSVIDVSKELRERDYKGHITLGGHFATFMYQEILNNFPSIDSVVLYEGEETLKEMASGKNLNEILGLAFRKNGQIINNGPRPLIENLNSLPFPSRDLGNALIKKGGLFVISSSRGCYNNCSYCTISSFYGVPPGRRFRLRSAENVQKELVELKKEFPELKDIWFVDDNFVHKTDKNFERTKKICETVGGLGLRFDIYLRANDVNEELLKIMVDNGLRCVFIGAEAGTNKTLQEIYKKDTSVEQTKYAINLCREFGINVDPGFIMFHPWSTMEEIGENIKFLKEIKEYAPYTIASFLTTYKFTPIGKEMLSGERRYKKPDIRIDNNLQDDVPYEIVDPKAQALLDLTLEVFEGFKQLPKAIRKLKAKARRDNDESLAICHGKQVREFSKMAMHYFERLYNFLNNNPTNIEKFYEEISKKVNDYSSRKISEIERLII